MFDIFNKYRLGKNRRINSSSNEDMWSEVFMRPKDSALPDSRKLMGGSVIILYLVSFLALSAIIVRIYIFS